MLSLSTSELSFAVDDGGQGCQGGSGGGRPPFGYAARAGRLTADPPELQTVAMARALQAEGLSLREIGRRLAEEDVRLRPVGNGMPPR